METLKQRFIRSVESMLSPKHLIVAVKLPTGATEIIHNTEQLESKIEYYRDKYDEEFRLLNAPAVQIIDFMIV